MNLDNYTSTYHFKREHPEQYKELRESGQWAIISKKISKKTNWNKEKVLEEVKKYTYFEEFRLGARGAYNWAKNNNCYEEVTKNLKHKKPGFTKEEFDEIVSKYKTKKEFREKENKLYRYASRKGWLKDLYLENSYQKREGHNKFIYWNKTKVLNAMKKCNSRNEFKNKYNGAYSWAKTNNCREKLYKKAGLSCKNRDRSYTYEKCLELIKKNKYQTMTDIRFKNQGMYSYLKNNKKVKTKIEKLFVSLVNNYSEKDLIKLSKKYNSFNEVQLKNPALYYRINQHRNKEKLFSHLYSNNIEHREKYYHKKFEKTLKAICKSNNWNIRMEHEVSLYEKDQIIGRIDYLIHLDDFNITLPIEIKHDNSHHSKDSLKSQINKYNKYFKKEKNIPNTYLLSPKGRYGFSENQFIKEVLEYLYKTNELTLPNFIGQLC